MADEAKTVEERKTCGACGRIVTKLRARGICPSCYSKPDLRAAAPLQVPGRAKRTAGARPAERSLPLDAIRRVCDELAALAEEVPGRLSELTNGWKRVRASVLTLRLALVKSRAECLDLKKALATEPTEPTA